MLLLGTAVLAIVGRILLDHRLRDIAIMVKNKCLPIGCEVHIVYDGELFDLISLERCHVAAETLQYLAPCHWETQLL